MATLRTDGSQLVVAMTRLERLAALHVDVRVPLGSVTAVGPTSSSRQLIHGLRAPGTWIPGVALYGTIRHDGQRDFAALHGHGPAVVVDLVDQPFRKLIVSVPDATATIEALGFATSP